MSSNKKAFFLAKHCAEKSMRSKKRMGSQKKELILLGTFLPVFFFWLN
jgi:hypothetical protein